MDSEVKVPDVAGYIEAYRTWFIKANHLVSRIFYKREKLDSYITWPSKEPLEAEHRSRFHEPVHNSSPPVHDCTCGIYAMKDPADLPDQPGSAKLCNIIMTGLALNYSQDLDLKTDKFFLPPYRPSVVGKIALWGKVFEGDCGYRAEYARPLELYNLFSIDQNIPPYIQSLASLYDIPVKANDDLEMLYTQKLLGDKNLTIDTARIALQSLTEKVRMPITAELFHQSARSLEAHAARYRAEKQIKNMIKEEDSHQELVYDYNFT